MSPDCARGRLDCPACPSPLARAPRVCQNASPPHDKLYLAPPALQGALLALVSRDTAHLDLTDAQRLSHFPASPLVTLSWYHGLDAGLVDRHGWHPFGARVMISGSQSRPLTSWAPTSGRGYMACFLPDVAQALFGLDLAAVQDRFVPAREAMGAQWQLLFDALLDAGDDAASMRVLEPHLGQRWRSVQGLGAGRPTLRQVGRHWVERLAWQAHEWRSTCSTRQVERRIKAFSGRSLRQWQALTLRRARTLREWKAFRMGDAGAGRRFFRPGPFQPRDARDLRFFADRVRRPLHRRRIVLDLPAVGVSAACWLAASGARSELL